MYVKIIDILFTQFLDWHVKSEKVDVAVQSKQINEVVKLMILHGRYVWNMQTEENGKNPLHNAKITYYHFAPFTKTRSPYIAIWLIHSTKMLNHVFHQYLNSPDIYLVAKLYV